MYEALEQMKAAVALAEDSPNRLEHFVEADLAFHNGLVDAARNSLLPVLLAPIVDSLLYLRRLASGVPAAMQDAIGYHSRILEHLKAGDGRACREAMREHLTKAEYWASAATS